MTKFLRRSWDRYSKLGKGRKKKQKWKKPTGRDNKMREKRKGYPPVVSIGHKKKKAMRGTLENKKPVVISNTSDLNKIKKEDIAILGNIGKKKKIGIIKKAKELKINFYNVNLKSFLKKNEIKKKIEAKAEKTKDKTKQKEDKSKEKIKENKK